MTFPSSGLDIYAPTFTVKLKEKNEIIPRGDISSVEIVEYLKGSGRFKVSFNDVLDIKKQKFRWLDDNRIQSGTLIEISFNYASSLKKNTLVFLGRINSVSHSFDNNGKSTLSVEGFDLSDDLKGSVVGMCVYNDKTYTQIVSDVASKSKLKRGKVDDSTQVYDNVSRQINRGIIEDDYQFIERLRNKTGFEFFVREESYHFRKPEDDKDAEIIFTNGINIINFTPRVNSSKLLHEVKVNSWNEYEKKLISQTAKLEDIKKCVYIPPVLKGQKPEKKIEKQENAPSEEEAKKCAIAVLKERNKFLFTGQMESIGNPSLRPGMTIKIEKVGKLFSGIYYIEKAMHSMNSEKYRTTLELRRCK